MVKAEAVGVSRISLICQSHRDTVSREVHHMILPLRSTKEVWAFDWFDLDVPIQFGSMFILPTCLYVVHRHTRMLLGHEFVRELDQRRVELFLHRAFQEKGAPDELLVPDVDEWDESVWQSFSKEYQCQINLVDVESGEVELG